MNAEADETHGLQVSRPRTISNASEQSQHSSKLNFPLMTSDSGLYTYSSNTSDCSLQFESDLESSHQRIKFPHLKDESLQLALQDVHKLRSELERLAQSEQWYKQELRQQKSTRLEDLERIYTQERKFMQENQRLQKECVRLYQKCNELERELQKQQQELNKHHVINEVDEEENENNLLQFEKEQQLAVIKDQHQLIAVLRKQKRSLLEDLRTLAEEKDEKVMELQRLLADMEFDNKRITKKCTQYAKERISLETNLRQSDSKLTEALQEKINLQNAMIDLKEQLDIQQQLLQLKESEIDNIQQHYTRKIQKEDNLDEVHKLSIKYKDEINEKTLEIIHLKERLHEMQEEMENMEKLQQQNELQQRQIDQLNFTLEAYHLELQELKTSEAQKNKQLEDLQLSLDQVLKDKENIFKNSVEQQNDLLRVKQALSATQQQYEQVQELYKKTQFQLELLEIEQGKIQFQSEKDRQEIEHLRQKLKEYLQQTIELSNKIEILEQELAKALKENLQLKKDTEQLTSLIKEMEENAIISDDHQSKLDDLVENKQKDLEELPFETSIRDTETDQDFLQLQQQCNKLQEQIDFIKYSEIHTQHHQILQTLNDFMDKIVPTQREYKRDLLENDKDILNLSLQSEKLVKNIEKLKDFLREKQILLSNLNSIQHSNESMKKLVMENEILKKKLNETETEAHTLQIKQDINERKQKYTQLKENLEKHAASVRNLQENLLKNDAKVYKLERGLSVLDAFDAQLEDLQRENAKLREQLQQEQISKTELKRKLLQETDKISELSHALEEFKTRRKHTKSKAVQCFLAEVPKESNSEVKELKQHVSELQQQQNKFLEQEAHKQEERVQFLRKMMDIQSIKMQNLQQHQQDWEEMLSSLKNAQDLEEKTRKELELKRMELEELNQVFAEQNEELRKLEEFTALLELKRQQEKEHLQLTFQQEIDLMTQHLQDYKQELEQQKLVNQQLEKQNERYQQDINEDFASEIAEYKKEIRELKSRVKSIMEEKEDLMEHLKEIEKQTKNLHDNKREAFFMPDLSSNKITTDVSQETSVENEDALKETINEDHLRILTKVLEAEYQRKMQRYDEHIHTLLTNLKSLKKSLKANEEKTALLSEEHIQTKEELKDLQKTRRHLEEMRLKYEQSQKTVKDLQQALAFERKKFELSDIGKSVKNNGSTYEASNLIDDYKKLIQQSALITKRPTTSAILDLIQRSNQCVPNLQKLESNVGDLRSEMQNFLSCYTHKMSSTPLIAAASLTVPPSLMDELRAASEGF